MNQKRQITEGVIWKQLLLFFFPIMLGTFFQQFYNTVDAIIVGRFVGANALAAVMASVTANVIVFRLWGPVLMLYLCVSAFSGTVYGYLGTIVAEKLRRAISFI